MHLFYVGWAGVVSEGEKGDKSNFKASSCEGVHAYAVLTPIPNALLSMSANSHFHKADLVERMTVAVLTP
jgi:hypothetical protein